MTNPRYSTPQAFKQVLELRLARARTTKDVDLRMMGTSAELLERFQAAGRLDLSDYMRFEVQRDRHHPEIQGEGMKYAGHRFTAECRLAGKVFGRPFGVDVGFGDPLVGEADEITLHIEPEALIDLTRAW